MKRAIAAVCGLFLLLGLFGGQLIGQSGQGPQTTTLIVKTAKGLRQADRQTAIERHGGVPKASIPALDLQVIEVPAAAADAITANLKKDAAFVRVEANHTRRWQGMPSDTMAGDQWSLPKVAWDQVYDTVTPQFLKTVAVLDTGVDVTHPDLIGAIAPGTSIIDDSNGTTDPNGHGTWLAGIVAARTNNLEGIAGVAYDNVQIMPVKVLNADGIGQDSDIIAGVIWAADHGASVILMAFSAPGFSEGLQEAIDYAWARGVVLVAAAGNDGSNVATFPAGDRGVIGVSATDQNDILTTTSNYGPSVFLGGPGKDILGTYKDAGYTSWSGTSASAAIVAGTAALMRAVDPSLTNGVVVNRIARTADPAGTQEQTGNGRVNLARALSDTSTDEIQPAGTAPVGNGGPFVGPYRIDSVSAVTIILPTGFTGLTVASGGSVSVPYAFSFVTGGAGVNLTTDITYNVYLRLGSTNYLIAGPVNQTGLAAGTHTVGSAGVPLYASVTFDGSGGNPPANTGASDETYVLRVEVTRNNGGQGPNPATVSSSTWVTVTPAAGSIASVIVGAPTGTATYGTPDDNVTFAIDATRGNNGNFTGNYSVSGLPAGVTASFSPLAGDANGNSPIPDSTLTLTVGASVDAGNYNFTVTLGGVSGGSTLVVSPRAVNLTGTRAYDGTTTASFSILTVSNAVVGDTVTVASGSATLASENVGAQAITNFAGLTLGGADAGNYTLTGATGSVEITSLAVNLSGTRPYDGTDTASFSILTVSNAVVGDTVTVASGSATLASENVGTRAITNFAGLTLGGPDAGNYTLTGATGSVTITALAVNLTGTRAYDGTTSASFSILTLSNAIVGETVTVISGTATLADKNVGPQAITSPGTLTLGGGDEANYTLTGATGSVTITALAVNLSGTRPYDGTDTASFSILTVSNAVVGDTVTVASGSATLASENVGTRAITNFAGLTLGGPDAGNYTLTGATGSVTITALAVNLTGTRVYDGTTSASFSILTVTNAIGGETVTVTAGTATLASKDFGIRAITSPGTLTLGGGDEGNYTLTGATGSVTITALAVNLTGTRVYNGTASASFSILTLSNKIGGDPVTVASGTGTLASKNVGLQGITDFGTLALGNNAAGNYTLTGATGSVTITALAVVLYGEREFDDTANAPASILSVTNAIAGDTVIVASGTGTLASKNVGLRTITDFGTLTLGGADVSNYTLTGATGSVRIYVSDDAVTRYIGERNFVTSGQSSTTAQVTLSASIQDKFGDPLSNTATVTFLDITNGLPGVVLAKDVPVSPLATNPSVGTAAKIITLSTGQYGAELYLIRVVLTGNYDNGSQLPEEKTATVVVSQPAGANTIKGGGTIQDTAATNVAGPYASSSVVSYSVGLNYNKQLTNIQGQIKLSIPQADGTIIVIKSNSISSMAVTNVSGVKQATVYSKASISRINADSTVTAIEGNVSLRLDVKDVADNTQDSIGFTVLSTKDSTLFYSNNWSFEAATLTWKTILQTLIPGSCIKIG